MKKTEQEKVLLSARQRHAQVQTFITMHDQIFDKNLDYQGQGNGKIPLGNFGRLNQKSESHLVTPTEGAADHSQTERNLLSHYIQETEQSRVPFQPMDEASDIADGEVHLDEDESLQ